MRKKRFAGFTLIEMLVVVAIILVLFTILVPAISKVREAGRSAKCISNLRQLQIAALNYANGGGLPPAVSSLSGPDANGNYSESKGWVAWYDYLPPSPTAGHYAQIGGFGLACISNGLLFSITQSSDIYICPTFKVSNPTYTRSYSMATNNNVSGASIFSVRSTTAVLFGDDKNCAASLDSQFDTNEVGNLHSGGKGNVIYLDGHVEKW